MPSLSLRAAVLVAFAACAACRPQSADTTLTSQPPVTVEPRLYPEPAAIGTPPPASTRAAGDAACDPASSFLAIKDGNVERRYAFGHMSDGRGAHHAFAEVVVHGQGSSVLLIEAFGGEKPEKGRLAITLMALEPGALPGQVGETRIEYMRPGAQSEREELVAHDQTIDITRFGAVGEVVEGSIGPVAVTSRRDGEMNLTVRFRVCRIADWHVRGP